MDLFVGAFEGDSFFYSVWVPDMMKCAYPNSGFNHVNFYGKGILAAIDQDSYLRTNYGDSYLEPRTISYYAPCHRGWSTAALGGIYHRGPARTYEVMCTAETVYCAAPVAVQILLGRVIEYMNKEAQRTGLTYFLIGESLEFLRNPTYILPRTLYVGIPGDETQKWLQLLHTLSRTTTFHLEHHEDGSLSHVRYSRHSLTRMVMWSVPLVHAGSQVLMVPYKKSKAYAPMLAAPLNTTIDYDGINAMCSLCQHCEKPRKEDISGLLKNFHNGLCLTRGFDVPLEFQPCSDV